MLAVNLTDELKAERDRVVAATRTEREARTLEVSDFARKRMDATLKELHEERDGVKALLGQ